MAAKLKDKIQNVMDEARMLILGSQVLLGFQTRAGFEPAFEKLPGSLQLWVMVGLTAILVAIGLLITPGAFHRIAEDGEDTERLHRLATLLLTIALLPIALAMGINFMIATYELEGLRLSIAAAAAVLMIAVFFWYVLEWILRRSRKPEIERLKQMNGNSKGQEKGTSVSDKIKHVLTEARVVLPGAQALLGFQFILILMESFERLPTASKYAHLASLALVGLAVILLITPAAYHRLVEQGEETEHFHRFASNMVVVALIPLSLGMCGDFYVVLQKVTGAQTFSIVASLLMLCFLYVLWFGLPLYARAARLRLKARQEQLAH
jgi:Family of unknown function (DUF6328)